jgi:hypothetical protein
MPAFQQELCIDISAWDDDAIVAEEIQGEHGRPPGPTAGDVG